MSGRFLASFTRVFRVLEDAARRVRRPLAGARARAARGRTVGDRPLASRRGGGGERGGPSAHPLARPPARFLQVLVFLDAHVEVTAGWLEPLLARVAAANRTVVSPTIDSISLNDFAYFKVGDQMFGGFSADLQFRWVAVPPRELRRRAVDPTAPWA